MRNVVVRFMHLQKVLKHEKSLGRMTIEEFMVAPSKSINCVEYYGQLISVCSCMVLPIVSLFVATAVWIRHL